MFKYISNMRFDINFQKYYTNLLKLMMVTIKSIKSIKTVGVDNIKHRLVKLRMQSLYLFKMIGYVLPIGI